MIFFRKTYSEEKMFPLKNYCLCPTLLKKSIHGEIKANTQWGKILQQLIFSYTLEGNINFLSKIKAPRSLSDNE